VMGNGNKANFSGRREGKEMMQYPALYDSYQFLASTPQAALIKQIAISWKQQMCLLPSGVTLLGSG
jgi:hypothetical protein